jgi:hypothetical protein
MLSWRRREQGTVHYTPHTTHTHTLYTDAALLYCTVLMRLVWQVQREDEHGDWE